MIEIRGREKMRLIRDLMAGDEVPLTVKEEAYSPRYLARTNRLWRVNKRFYLLIPNQHDYTVISIRLGKDGKVARWDFVMKDQLIVPKV